MKAHVFKTLFNESTNETFKLNIYFEDSGFHMTIVEDFNAWKATVTLDGLSKLAEELDCPLAEYYDKLRNYLSESQEDSSFIIEDDNFVLHQLIRNKDNIIKVNLFHCAIEKADYKKTVECLLDNFFIKSREIETKFEDLQKQYELLRKSENECRNKLEEFVSTKRIQEEDLYRNFVVILNEKKKRIQHLYELLEAFKKGRNPTNPTVITKKFKRKKENNTPTGKRFKKETVSDSESERSVGSAGYKTDDEVERSPSFSEKSNNNIDREREVSKPSTSKANDNLFIEDEPTSSMFDLFEGDSPPEDALLPKRLKKTAHSQFNDHCSRIETKAGKSGNTEKTNGVPKNKNESKPTVDFNTQDLLDML